MTNVAEQIVTALAGLGVRTVWGVVGDALNPVTDAIRRNDRLEWVGTRHEEVAAFAAGAQAQLTGTLGVCMGTVGPGSIHLLNGLYDAKKSHAPVLALCGQVPVAQLGSEYFQEVDNQLLFRDVADFCHTITSAEQMPRLLEQAVQAAYAGPGVAVLTLPADVGSTEVQDDVPPRFTTRRPITTPDGESLARAVELVDAATKVTLLVGIGAREAREEVLALADHLSAPMVLTIKAKEGLEQDNPFEVGQSGLIGNPASKTAFDDADLLLMVGTDFPYPEWLPQGTTTVQLDLRAQHIGRRTRVDVGLVGDAAPTLRELTGRLAAKTDRAHLQKARGHYESWCEGQRELAEPDHDEGSVVGRIRARLDNSDDLIRPEALAEAVDRLAAADAVITADTGMSTVWLSRFVRMSGARRLLGSFNLGSMANAMPQALGGAGARPQPAGCRAVR